MTLMTDPEERYKLAHAIGYVDPKKASCVYDLQTRIGIVTYFGRLTPETTVTVYSWIAKAFVGLGVDQMLGGIFDFRLVTQFDTANLSTVQRTSGKLNTNFDFSAVPTAMIVSNPYQEQFLRVSMKITPQEQRKRIVKTEDEALAFILSFRNSSEETSDVRLP
ncbi:MAG: hypothetical protein MUF87_09995 [Anaerolineae bacterium]|jgi:hypothetical protein|nr:hypothetical protein [Anaerolineae bacterium]